MNFGDLPYSRSFYVARDERFPFLLEKRYLFLGTRFSIGARTSSVLLKRLVKSRWEGLLTDTKVAGQK